MIENWLLKSFPLVAELSSNNFGALAELGVGGSISFHFWACTTKPFPPPGSGQLFELN